MHTGVHPFVSVACFFVVAHWLTSRLKRVLCSRYGSRYKTCCAHVCTCMAWNISEARSLPRVHPRALWSHLCFQPSGVIFTPPLIDSWVLRSLDVKLFNTLCSVQLCCNTPDIILSNRTPGMAREERIKMTSTEAQVSVLFPDGFNVVLADS